MIFLGALVATATAKDYAYGTDLLGADLAVEAMPHRISIPSWVHLWSIGVASGITVAALSHMWRR